MAIRFKSMLLPALLLAAVALLGLAASWNDFFLLRAKTYSVPAGSMEPTLQVGDMFVAEQAASFLGDAEAPRRGDIVVFALPTDPDIVYVKRLVGLPGDRLQIQDGRLYLNGAPLKTDKIDDYVQQGPDGATRHVPRYRETLPNGRVYEILDVAPDSFMDNTSEFEVPDGHFFVLGDNRDNSVDSRVISRVGYVPFENLTGIAQDVYFSGPDQSFTWRSVVAGEQASGPSN